MNLHCDLHSHSTTSDGTLSPTELVQRAHEKGVEVFALTDHDATEGLNEAAITADKLGLSLLPVLSFLSPGATRLFTLLV